MNELKFCPKCGGKIQPMERFCGECGFDTHALDHAGEAEKNLAHSESLKAPNIVHEYGSQGGPIHDPQTGRQKDASKMAIIVVSAILGSVFLIGGILFWWFGHGSALFSKTLVSGSEQKTEKGVILALPSYSLNEGNYTSEQKVEINKPDGKDVQVYFTVDGSEPTVKSTKYENPIILKNNTTLKSIAIDKDGNYSETKTGTYNIAIQQPATTQEQTKTVTTVESSEATERAQFEQNIAGTWKVTESSGFTLYYQFKNGNLTVTDGGSDYVNSPYTFNIVSGNNGTVGTVSGGGHTMSIDCNPLKDNAIYIDGSFASYVQ